MQIRLQALHTSNIMLSQQHSATAISRRSFSNWHRCALSFQRGSFSSQLWSEQLLNRTKVSFTAFRSDRLYIASDIKFHLHIT